MVVVAGGDVAVLVGDDARAAEVVGGGVVDVPGRRRAGGSILRHQLPGGVHEHGGPTLDNPFDTLA